MNNIITIISTPFLSIDFFSKTYINNLLDVFLFFELLGILHGAVDPVGVGLFRRVFSVSLLFSVRLFLAVY